jgi:arylsulfatase A-like enzyme
MKIAISALFLSLFTLFSSFEKKKAAVSPEKMNVIFILADDLGWSDCTLFGKTKLYETPNLERLAKRGMTFSNAHSASPLCSPTRASILTGQTPARTGITAPECHLPQVRLKPLVGGKAPVGDKSVQCQSVTRLSTQLPTLGKVLKAEGYATAHFGKWHLGPPPYSPLEHGFDVDIPHTPGPGPSGSFVAPWKFPSFKENKQKEHIEDRMADEAIKWMRTLDKNQPFYMNFWQFSVHAPFDAKAELIDYYRPKIDTTQAQRSSTYAAMVHSMDDAVGKLLDEIDRLGIADRTIIVFISDNGGNMYDFINETTIDGKKYTARPTSNEPLRGGKATMFEGGIRVPCVVVMPKIAMPEKRSDALIQTTDFYPTLLNQLGIALPQNHVLDGVDITPALRGEAFKRKPMFTYFPHAPKVPDWLPAAVAVTNGDWKLIRQFYQGDNGKHGYLLYNLKRDIGEKKNLANKKRKKVKEMDALIENYLAETKAVIPLPNPAFDVSKYHPERIGIQTKNNQ